MYIPAIMGQTVARTANHVKSLGGKCSSCLLFQIQVHWSKRKLPSYCFLGQVKKGWIQGFPKNAPGSMEVLRGPTAERKACRLTEALWLSWVDPPRIRHGKLQLHIAIYLLYHWKSIKMHRAHAHKHKGTHWEELKRESGKHCRVAALLVLDCSLLHCQLYWAVF